MLFKSNKARIVVASIALAGLGIMVYLTYIHFANAKSFCDITKEVSCDVVTTSLYSEIFGIPVSLLGLGYFALVLALVFFNKKEKIFQTIFLITFFSILPSLYLTLTEILFIKSICILCETSKVLMLAILGLSYYEAKKHTKITFSLVAPILFAGLIAAGVIFFIQSGGGTREDYTPFVECLNNKGVVYYKSVRCSNCRRQEKMLGVAYTKLNSVECHPEGINPQPELCLAKKIDKTPTFLIEKDGGEAGRLEGLTPLQKLADFAGCALEAKKK